MTDIIVSVIFGALTGWITNSIAVNMLFKKYGRWGGVIEENYQSFITNMSALIEDDLVNYRTLAPEFNGEGFKRAVQKWVTDMMSRELPQNSGDVPFEAIADIETSAGRLASLLESSGGPLAQSLFAWTGNFSVENILSEKQYDYVAERIAEAVMLEADKHSGAIRQALAAFLDGKKTGSLISEDAVRRLACNAAAIVRNMDLSKFSVALDTACDSPFADTVTDGLVTEFLRQLESMRLIDFIKDSEEFARALPGRIAAFAGSEKGRDMLRGMCGKLLSAASRLDIKLSGLVSSSAKEGIARFCGNEMPRVIDSVIGFVRSKRREIEEIVNYTVDNELEKTRGGWGGKILKDIFVENLANKIGVVEKIAGAAQRYRQTAGANISGRIMSFIETKTVGEIITAMRDAGILSENIITDLACSNMKDLSGAFSKFIIDFLEKPISVSLGDLSIVKPIVKTMLLPKVFNCVKTEYLLTDKFKDHICSVVAAKITELPDKSASVLFNAGAMRITFDKRRIKTRLAAFWRTVAGMKISVIAGKKPPEYMRIKKDSLLKIWNRNKSQKLRQLYGAVRGDSVYADISEWLVGVIDKNIDTVLTGQVSAAVEAELNKLQPKEINGVVQDFIGKEMKAINILGAFLGAIAGLLPPLAGWLFNIPQAITWQTPLAYGIIFALVGIGTNWLAIRMLFRPYKPLFERAKFPPFTGIVAARKPQFAKNTANFIKDRMLAEQTIKQRFTDNKAAIKQSLHRSVAASDYAVIDAVFDDPKRLDGITAAAFRGVKKHILEHRAEISAMLAGKIKQLADTRELDCIIPELQNAIADKLRTGNIASAVYKAIKNSTAGKTLESCREAAAAFFSDDRLGKLLTDTVDALAENVTPKAARNFIDSRNDRFVSYIASHSLEDFAGTGVIKDLSGKTDVLIDAVLQNAVRTAVEHIEKQFDPKVKLRNLCNGIIPCLLEKNSAYITDALCGKIKKLKGVIVRTIQDGLPFYALPWRGHVAPVVNTLIDSELPVFLDRNRQSLAVITDALLDNTLADTGFDESPLESGATGQVAEAFTRRLSQDTARSAATAVRRFARLPLSRSLGLINIRQTGDIAFEPLLTAAVSTLKNNLSREDTARAASALIKKILPDILKTVPVADLIAGIDIEKETGILVSRILNDRNVINAVYDGTGRILFTAIKSASFYDDDALRNDLSGFIALAVQDSRLEAAVMPCLREFLTKLNGAVTNETKDCICGYITGAMVDTCEHNFNSIFESVDAARVVEREINNMHPREIETLFNKFAGNYFKKIIFYGWIGLFGGVLGYFISCLLKIIL